MEVRNLPNHIDHNTLYDIFRPYGPLSICKPITEDGSHRGKALVQFFNRYHSDSSVSDLVSFCTPIILFFVLNNLLSNRITKLLMAIQCKQGDFYFWNGVFLLYSPFLFNTSFLLNMSFSLNSQITVLMVNNATRYPVNLVSNQHAYSPMIFNFLETRTNHYLHQLLQLW